jgi:hypothetical protein
MLMDIFDVYIATVDDHIIRKSSIATHRKHSLPTQPKKQKGKDRVGL